LPRADGTNDSFGGRARPETDDLTRRQRVGDTTG
jgi:hypothetical protein